MVVPARIYVVFGFISIIFWSYSAFAETTSADPCPPFSHTPTKDEILLGAKEGGCVNEAFATVAQPDKAADAIKYLSSRVCPGKSAGFPANFNPNDTSVENWNQIRKTDGYVYFQIGNAAMNPGTLACFQKFFELAESRGYQPCVNAALRTPAHQRASCQVRKADGSYVNKTVCGRSRGCPNNLSAYLGCNHLDGISMDIQDRRDPPEEIKAASQAILALARASGAFSLVGVNDSDPAHIEAAGCAGGKTNINHNVNDTGAGGAFPFTGGGGSFGGGGASGNWLQQLTKPLMDYFRQQQQPPPQQMPPQSMAPQVPTAPPPPQIGDAFAPTAHPPASFPTSTASAQKIIPKLPAEKLEQIAVTHPSGTTTPTTTPLTHEEYERLYGQQTVVVPPQLPTTVVVTNNQPVVPSTAPYAGFIPPIASQYILSDEPMRAFLQAYVQVLTNVARTLRNVLHRLRGEPLEVVY